MSKNIKQQKRIEWIDVIRGIAILMIIIGHSLDVYSTSYLSALIYIVHVPIFFILSGYLFKERKNIVAYAKHLSISLLLPYVFTGLIILLLSVVFWRHQSIIFQPYGESLKWTIEAVLYGTGAPGKLWLGKLYYPPYIGAIWFLAALFFGCLLYATTIKLSQKIASSKRDETYANILISITLTIIGFVLGTNLVKLPWSITSALASQIFFLIGHQIHANKTNLSFNKYLLMACVIIWAVSAKSGMFLLVNGNGDNPWAGIIGALGAAYTIKQLADFIANSQLRAIKIIKRYLVFLGRLSIIVLCIHLIDLNNIRIGGNIINYFAAHNLYIAGLLLQIIYRILICSLACLAIPHIPIVRSFFLYKNYPLFNKVK